MSALLKRLRNLNRTGGVNSKSIQPESFLHSELPFLLDRHKCLLSFYLFSVEDAQGDLRNVKRGS